MEKHNIIVPRGIRYISDWKEYNLRDFQFPHILDKVLTGCGYTEYCLRNDQDLILCSPRRMLLENKEQQHRGEIFYARNEACDEEFDRVFTESEGKKKANQKIIYYTDNTSSTSSIILKLKQDVIYYYNKRKSEGKPVKIIVTYDSFRHVKEALLSFNLFQNFQVVVDEFQSVLVDVKFKSNTELELLNQLLGIQRVCFVSATPMLDKYLGRLDEFKELPYYKLDWLTEDPGRVINPNLQVHKTDSIFKDITKIITKYQNNQFDAESWVDDSGLIHETQSREAVIYVNSVKTICSVISRFGLTLENTNVLCARTPDNEEKLRKSFNEVQKRSGLDKKYKKEDQIIGYIPKKGEPHKMFTFCTRTVYLGADFYSTNAKTYIFSDSNIDCLSVDISLDLPQILGRQRLDENPWKNSADLYIKSTLAKLSREDFDRELKQKIEITNDLLLSYNTTPTNKAKHSLASAYEDRVKSLSYKKDYVAVNHHAGSDLIPVFNNLMLIADERSFDIQQIDYKDRVSVFNTLKIKGFITIEVDKELEIFNNIPYYHDKMRYVCQLSNTLDSIHFDLFLNSISKDYKNYYVVLGSEGCSACKFRRKEMEIEYQRIIGNQRVDFHLELDKQFKVGERYLFSDIKKILTEIYNLVGYQQTPKATDLEEWYVLKSCQITNPITKKREHGYKILAKK